MKRRTDKKQGLAIITTMLILTLLLGLIAAFLVVNRAGNRFTVSSVQRRTAQDVCMTAFSYAMFQLEKDRAWGNGDNPVNLTQPYPLDSPQVRMIHTQSEGVPIVAVEGAYSQSGNFDEPQGTFTMIIENNLGSNDEFEGGSSVDVPARAARIRVEANVGGVTRELTTLLRPEPISHDGMAAGNNVNLDETLDVVRIESRDPYVNRIRAGNDLNLPFESDVQFLKHGVGASSNELNVGGSNLAVASDDAVRTAGETSGGVYKPNAAPLEIQEFDPNEITLPNNSTNIPAGTWTFGEVTAIEYNEHTLTFDTPPPPDSPPGTPGGTDTTLRYQRKTSMYNQLTSPSGQVYTAAQAIEGTEALDPPYDPAPSYGSEGAANSYGYGDTSDSTAFTGQDVHEIATGFKANVTTAQMVVHPEYALRVPGDFIVEAAGDRQPELYFGYDLTGGGVATQLSLADGLEAAQNEPGKYMAGIVAEGDVNVVGGVLGYGSMIAGGDLTIKASSGLRVAPDLGVVVKGNRVIINPATEPEPGFPGEPVPFDYDVYRGSIQTESGGDWSLYNGWLDHDQPTRDGVIDSLGQTSTGSNPSVLWNTLCSEIGETFPPPDFSAHGWPSGPATVNQYMRLKEFLQTRASGYNGGNGDASWLDLNQRQEDSAGRVAGVLNGIAQWAKSFKQSFEAFLTNPDQGPPDMFLEGLIYADEDIIIDATGKTIRLEGAVVAKNDINIASPSAVDIVYNRSLLDDLTDAGSGPVRLERVFFTLE